MRTIVLHAIPGTSMEHEIQHHFLPSMTLPVFSLPAGEDVQEVVAVVWRDGNGKPVNGGLFGVSDNEAAKIILIDADMGVNTNDAPEVVAFRLFFSVGKLMFQKHGGRVKDIPWSILDFPACDEISLTPAQVLVRESCNGLFTHTKENNGRLKMSEIAFHDACRFGNLDEVRRLWDANPGVVWDDVALMFAAENGHDLVVGFLLDSGVDPCVNDSVALRWAAKNGHEAVVSRLIKAGANVRAKDDLALRWAKGKAGVVGLLLKAGADPHANNDEALRFAASDGHVAEINLLLEAGANVHANNDEALRSAIEFGHAKAVEVLLDADADVHAEDDAPRRLAVDMGRDDLIALVESRMKKNRLR